MNSGIAIVFHRFGPYHMARLKAAARRFPVLAIEESDHTSEYDWDEIPGESGFQRLTLMHRGEVSSGPLAREIARRLHVALARYRPRAIAIPGWSDPAALAALAWGLENEVRVIVMSESTAFDDRRHAWKEDIKTRIVRLCAAALAGGTPHAQYLEKLGLRGEQIFTGYDAVDNDYFATGAEAARADEAAVRLRCNLPPRYFLASSRFVEQKNLPVLLSAYATYRREAGDGAWKLVLIGDGPMHAQLVEIIAKLDVAEDVFLPGFKQYNELPSYYGLAGAFVHASTREPWGLVVNEAMAAGLPVLVSNRCGCAQDLVVPGENGYVFSPTWPDALAELMAKVAQSPPPRLSEMAAASRRIVDKWSLSNFAENLRLAVLTARSQPPRRASWMDRVLIRTLIRLAERQARLLSAATS